MGWHIDENDQDVDAEQEEEKRILDSRRERGIISRVSGKIGDTIFGGTADRNGTNDED